MFFLQGINKCQLIDKLLLAETEVLTRNNPQVELDLLRDHNISQLFQDPKSQHLTYEETQSICNTTANDPHWTESSDEVCKLDTLEPITVDFSYIEVSCPGIPNPTYNLTVTDLTRTPPDNNNIVLVSGYLLQPTRH